MLLRQQHRVPCPEKKQSSETSEVSPKAYSKTLRKGLQLQDTRLYDQLEEPKAPDVPACDTLPRCSEGTA
jgi:hypothetical protein